VREKLFLSAYPLAHRAAGIRSAAAAGLLNSDGIDREDLVQELVLEVWIELSRFDPLRSSLRTFIERVIASKTASEIRTRHTQKRTRSDYLPASRPVHMIVPVELGLDIRRALRTLSLVDQKMARLLVHYKPVEIAREYGISRGAVYRSRERIAAALKRFGVEQYLTTTGQIVAVSRI